MKICVIRPSELSANDIAIWHSMQSSTPSLANPFLSPEFVITAGEFRPNARVAVLSEESSVVGFFPFERSRFGAGTPIAPGLTDCQGLIHAPAVGWDAHELLRACGLSAWHFDHLVNGQLPFQRYRTALRPSLMLDLTQGFEVYRKELSARSPYFLRNLQRKERKLVRDAGELRFVPDSNDVSAFRHLLTWKSSQYQRTGQVDLFARPWVSGLMEALFNSRNEHFSGLLSSLYVDEILIASQFGLRSGGVFADWFPAYNREFRRYSPGLLMVLRMAECASSVGIRTIDLGTGTERFKEELKNAEIFVSNGTVTTGSLLAATHRAGKIGGAWTLETIKRQPTLFQATKWLRKRYRVARNAYLRSASSRSM